MKLLNFLKSLSVFLGTVVGVGIFGLPFAALKSGFFVILGYFFFMTFIAMVIHFLFGIVTVETEEKYRLPGYVGKYLGEKWKKVSFLITGTGLLGALLAYLIIGGQFLNSIFQPYLGGNSIIYTFLFFSFGAYLVFRDIRSISEIEIILLIVFLLIIFSLFIKSYTFINPENLKNIHLENFAFPFGLVLFSLWGTSIVPELKEMIKDSLANKEKTEFYLKIVISSGLILSAFIYLFFVYIILGVSGSKTSTDAMSGLANVLGSNSDIIKIGFIFGVICSFTSFLSVALTLKKTFWFDFHLSKNFSWFLSCFLPLFLFILGARQFIKVISFSGAIAVGSEGIIIIFLYKKFLEKKFKKQMPKAFYLLIPIFILGIILEIIHF